MKDKAQVKGQVTVTVFDADGNIKKRKKTSTQQFFRLPANRMISTHHNIVTSEGDALIADWLSAVPTKTRVDAANGYIQVGTGWTGNGTKDNTGCNTATGTPEPMDATHPKTKGVFNAVDDHVVVYRVTFEAGKLNCNGINEAALLNGTNPASCDCLAYAQITPAVNVATTDTLQIEWEISFVGN